MAGQRGRIIPSATAAILLGAGAGARFGGDKLAAKIGNKTILTLSAAALAQSGVHLRAAILRAESSAQTARLKALGFTLIFNDDAKDGLSTSIRAGVGWAQSQGAAAVLIALADMPFVTSAHYARLIERAADDNSGVIYSRDAERRSPPAIFAACRFADLMTLEGDAGARDLLLSAPESDGVAAPPEMLADIDTADDLRRAVRRMSAPPLIP